MNACRNNPSSMSELLPTNSGSCTIDCTRSVFSVCLLRKRFVELAANQQWGTLNQSLKMLMVTEQHTSAHTLLFYLCHAHIFSLTPSHPHTHTHTRRDKKTAIQLHIQQHGDTQIAVSRVQPHIQECTSAHQNTLRPVSLWAWLCVDYCMIFTAGVWEAL